MSWQISEQARLRESEDGPLPGDKPGKYDNWVDEVGGLPRYIRRIAKDLMQERGMTKSRAIATAISRVKVWAATSKHADVRAKAAAAVAEWEAKRARAHAK